MIRRLTAISAAPLALLAAPAIAQDAYAEPYDIAPSEAETIDRMTETLSDPARQEALATSLAVATEILLDLPLAPILNPLARAAGEATGEPVRRVDPDTTLRRIAPDAGRVTAEIQDKLPRAMDSMGAMTGAVAGMLPALRDMAARLEAALPRDGEYRY